MAQNFILIGFKNAGKTVLGKKVAELMQLPFVDLDEELIHMHAKSCPDETDCREIFNRHGEVFFRALESLVLEDVLKRNFSQIVALGGGTPLSVQNQNLLKGQTIIHVTAPKELVFERIMAQGKPAFFSPNEDDFLTFEKLWAQRLPVFEKLAHFTAHHEDDIESLIESINR